jgi:hypothetical protein
MAHHGRTAAENGAASPVAHQVCVDYTVVQHMKTLQKSDFGLQICPALRRSQSAISSLKSEIVVSNN